MPFWGGNQNRSNQNYPNQNQRGQNPYAQRQNPYAQRQNMSGAGNQGQFSQGQSPQGQLPQRQPQSRPSQNGLLKGPLPDGVRMEPLDEKTLKELQSSLGVADVKAEEGEGIKSQISVDNKEEVVYDRNWIEIADSLGEFIQNERNATIYYRHLSGLAQSEEHKRILEEISVDSQSRNEALNEIYKKYKGADFDMKNSAVNTRIGFQNGIELAIREESKSLNGFSRIYERISDEKASRIINAILYRKVSYLSILHLIYGNERH